MKINLGLFVTVGVVSSIAIATASFTHRNLKGEMGKGEQLARKHCGTCHLFPDANLLNKENWEKHVLPQMAFRMGFKDDKILYSTNMKDLAFIKSTLPASPMVSQEEFDLIRKYYLSTAPESLISIEKTITDTIRQFTPQMVNTFKSQSITLLTYDSINKKLYAGDTRPWLYTLNKKFQRLDSLKLPSAPTHLVDHGESILLSVVGNLFPSDQANGKLLSIDKKTDAITYVIDSLKRPVYFNIADINHDQNDELILCSFGNYTGALSIYEDDKKNHLHRMTLTTSPGARKTLVADWDKDGKEDIIALMTQGDERLVLYKNKDDLKFEEKTLMRFPPIYGSSYFRLIDFNNDGLLDILYTNGDNADYSPVVKPYHGIKLFQQNKKHEIQEIWSYPMPGAWKAKAIDFDKDGDLDIAAIALFPDSKRHPKQSFIYFENLGKNNFKPSVTSLSANHNWMAMITFDIDDDGDIDIVLGAFNFQKVMQRSANDPQLMILKNNGHI
jgi:hypothetical protein